MQRHNNTPYTLLSHDDPTRCEACWDRVQSEGRPVKLGTMGTWTLCPYHAHMIADSLCRSCGDWHYYNCPR